MNVLVVGAGRGLGRAIVEALTADGHRVTGVSRRRPAGLDTDWIEADLADPGIAVPLLAELSPAQIDALIWNLGPWEPTAFSPEYDFLQVPDEVTTALVTTNVTAPILALRALMPRILTAPSPRVILTGSTSALPRSGRPELAFGASKTALNGIADALRESYRDRGLRVTTLQLGYLNTEDPLSTPRAEAAGRGDGTLIPVHDVVTVLRTILDLSDASFIREILMPAVRDERF